MRTRGRGREENQNGQVTRKMNNQHINLFFCTSSDNHSPDLLCDIVVEYTSVWKWNLNEVLVKGNSYRIPSGLQKILYSSVWIIYGGTF